MTVSSRTNSHIGLSRIDETRGNITVEEGDLLVNEKNIDRHAYTHHMATGQNATREIPEVLSGHIPTHRERTQPQNMIRELSRDSTVPLLENNHERACNDRNTSISNLAETIERTSTQQRPTTFAILKPASTYTLTFDCKIEKFELV